MMILIEFFVSINEAFNYCLLSKWHRPTERPEKKKPHERTSERTNDCSNIFDIHQNHIWLNKQYSGTIAFYRLRLGLTLLANVFLIPRLVLVLNFRAEQKKIEIMLCSRFIIQFKAIAASICMNVHHYNSINLSRFFPLNKKTCCNRCTIHRNSSCSMWKRASHQRSFTGQIWVRWREREREGDRVYYRKL